MASSFKSSKRPHEQNPLEPNGRGKWQKTGPNSASQNQLKILPGATVFRVLCPSSKFGSIIGKGGGIVSKIRQETGAKVRIEDSVPGCDERVVVITGSEKEAKSSNERSKEDQKETGAADGGGESKATEENNDKKEDSSAVEDSKSEKAMTSAQKALMLVYERLIEGEQEDDAGDEEQKKSNSVSVRLLIRSSQVGSLLGKGGSVIKHLSSDSGAQIQIFSKDAVPLCASSIDEVVQIVGGVDSVRNAVQSVSQLLLENPPRDRDSFTASNPSGPSHQFPSFPRPEVLPPANFLPHAQGPPFLNRPFDNPDFHPSIPPSFPKFHDGAAPGQFQFPPEPITYRLLCSSDKVGSLIGKGGSIIKTIQQETGCEIKIHEAASESEDRIISASGPTFPGDRISPPQDAILRILERIIVPVIDKRDSMVSRLLVSSNQTGCLIGKGGSIIAEMRKVSGAQIRILAKDQLPKSVGENDDVVQAIGEFRAVQEAVVQITSKLRDHLFRDKVTPMNHAVLPPVDQMPPFGPFMGRREPSPRPYSNFPPFQSDAVGRPTEERSAFPNPLHSSAVPHASARMPPALWASQGIREGGGPMHLPDFPGAHRRPGGFPGGNQPAVITNTTVDVVVPRALVPSIYGEDGFCLRRIREISEAKITITEPRPEATETVIIISGIPEQTHAAQSLLQAFVLNESGGP